MATSLEQKVDPDLERLLKRYPYEVTQYRDEQYQNTKFNISYRDKFGSIHMDQFVVDDDKLLRISNPADAKALVLQELEYRCRLLTVSIGEQITGNYPFARLWCDRHLTNRGINPYFGSPEVPIPGWAWPKIKSKSDYPEDGSVQGGAITREFNSADIDDNGNDPISQAAFAEKESLRRKRQLLLKVEKTEIHGAHSEMILEGIEMASTAEKKRKVKVVKKAIDPSTVKKPNCKVHNTSMEFDPVTQKWRCQVEGCNLVARPKGDDTDREVRVGKGNIQCRLISNEGELTVVLISDDNVTLDITRFVDVPKLMDEFDAVTIADAASTNGRETFSINDPKQLPIKMSLTVMGATDLVVHNSED